MYLYIVVGLALLVSLVFSRDKTLRALKIAARRFMRILPAFLIMLALISFVLYLVPDEAISRYLGSDNKFTAMAVGAFLGCIIYMPGFIAFPLAGILLHKGVVYMVIAAFTTTLMMVGVLTAPIEKAYFGLKVTIIRNAIGFGIALAVSCMIGLFFGEIF
jgi:uncharacterized membrane protein YraQ (UPF0718 family)